MLSTINILRTCQRVGQLYPAEVWTPAVTQVRHNRNRPNLQRPLPYHFKKVRLLEVVKPQYPPELEVCESLRERKFYAIDFETHGYARFLARELLRKFNTHPMIAIFHKNSFKEHEFLKIRGMLFDAKFPMLLRYQRINKAIYNHALKGTKFEPVLPLIEVQATGVGFCKTTDVATLLKLMKKIPQFILLGLVIEDRFLHRADIEKLAELPDLTTLHGRLSHTLNLTSANIASNLQANQIQLSRNLALHSASASDVEEKLV